MIDLGLFRSRSRVMAAFCFTFVLAFAGVIGAQTQPPSDDDDEAPAFLIVIFSPEVDNSRRSMAQGAVWKSFVDKMKKRTTKLSVVNEVTINEVSDRARALELARQFNKFTIWLQFISINPGNSDIQYQTRGPAPTELLALKYVVFAPESNDILSSGEVEQERIPGSTFQTLSKGTTPRRSARLPDGSTTSGPDTTDLDSLKRVGEIVANRALSAVKKKKKD